MSRHFRTACGAAFGIAWGAAGAAACVMLPSTPLLFAFAISWGAVGVPMVALLGDTKVAGGVPIASRAAL